jgi:twitching motility two-component system response regulator PilH
MQPHILIIEDNLAFLTALGKTVAKHGYRVTTLTAFSSMQEVIDLQADCIIIDEHLPVVTGHIICIMLKSNAQTKDIPVILMSGYEKLDYFAALSQSDAYLRKPFTFAELYLLLMTFAPSLAELQ